MSRHVDVLGGEVGRVLDRLFFVLCSDYDVSRFNRQSVHRVVQHKRHNLLAESNLKSQETNVMCSEGQMGYFGMCFAMSKHIQNM